MIGAVFLAIVAVVGLIIKSEHDKEVRKRRLIAKLKKQWGDVPSEEYTAEKLRSLAAYYNAVKEDTDVDDITWNDIDMDQIFMTMNNTSSAVGEEYLYAMLHKLKFEEEELKERNRLIEFFSSHEEERLRVQEIFSGMGKVKNVSIYEYMNRLNNLKKENNMTHYFLILALFVSVALIFVAPVLGIVCTVGSVINNIVRYYQRKSEVESYFTVVSYLIRLLDSVKEFNALKIEELKIYTKQLKEVEKAFQSFRKGARIVASKKPTGDMTDVFVDYIRMIFHVDLIKFNSMMKTFENNEEALNTIFDTIGLIDSMIAVASFRELMGEYCLPVLEESSKPFIETEEIYHPMLTEPVKSSISEKGCVLITGSNASGKSTFIKTLAINAILSQTIYTSLSKSYHASYFKVKSSMALQDNIYNNESYYIVEIKSLKRILDSLDEKIPTLCFVDEVLRGTNTLERIAASSRILLSFAKENAMCFAATHDIELTHILENYYANYHFQEQVVDNEILFDYKLYQGRAVSKNAIKLLGIIGYSEEIIEEATEAANLFLEEGEWSVIA